MNIEYEEFEKIEDVFMFLSSAAMPMKNTLPINSYRGYIISVVPLGNGANHSYLMIYSPGTLESGVYEFDIATRSYRNVNSIERADKVYFIVMNPKRNTIADKALQGL